MVDKQECDYFSYSTYVVGSNSRPKALFQSFVDSNVIRVFRSSNQNSQRGKYFPKLCINCVIFRYDGLYFVSGATDNEGNDVSKNLQKRSDANPLNVWSKYTTNFQRCSTVCFVTNVNNMALISYHLKRLWKTVKNSMPPIP